MSDPMHSWAQDLWPICRSLTGQGVRDTFEYLGRLLPGLRVHSVPTGYQAFDWEVPKEWAVRDAFIARLDGTRVVDFKNNNLHLLGYSTPIDAVVTHAELNDHLYSLKDQPDAVPYVTSYYKERWGFCLSENQRSSLTDDHYRVVIDTELKPGVLNYADLLIPGEEKTEVLLSTYVCHPSMANNELSGPVVTTALARWISSAPRRHTYRIVFIPETIGAVVYLSKNLREMKANTIAGYVITCVGDERAWSYMPSRMGGTLADRAALHVMRNLDFDTYSFLERGSDERQYCAPTIDLPVASVMRSKYGTYPEYHTSLDDLSLVTQAGLEGSFDTLKACIEVIEGNRLWQSTTFGEPQLGKRGLYPTISMVGSAGGDVREMMNFLAYCDGKTDIISIANTIGISVARCVALADRFVQHGLLRELP